MNKDRKSFKEELNNLNLEQKFQLLGYYSRSDMSAFIKTKENLLSKYLMI